MKAQGEYIVTSTHTSSPDARRTEKEEDRIPQLRKVPLLTVTLPWILYRRVSGLCTLRGSPPRPVRHARTLQTRSRTCSS